MKINDITELALRQLPDDDYREVDLTGQGLAWALARQLDLNDWFFSPPAERAMLAMLEKIDELICVGKPIKVGNQAPKIAVAAVTNCDRDDLDGIIRTFDWRNERLPVDGAPRYSELTTLTKKMVHQQLEPRVAELLVRWNKDGWFEHRRLVREGVARRPTPAPAGMTKIPRSERIYDPKFTPPTVMDERKRI